MSAIADLIAEHTMTAGATPRQRYTLDVWDDDKSLLRMLEFLQKCGNDGHSVRLEEKDDRVSFGFDGDGADRILDIKVEDLT